MRTLSILKTLSAMAAVSAVAVIVTGGKASAVTINLGGLSPSIKPSFNFNNVNNSGILLTASGVINTPPGTRQVYQSILGLGVSDTNALGDLNTNQIGGPAAVGETLLLTFTNGPVYLNSVTFSRVGTNDSFKLFVDGNQFIASGDIPGNSILKLVDSAVGTSNVSKKGSTFAFSLGDKANGNGYLVSSVNVTAVPEPITIAGMALGSGFGVILRRKYKKAAKFSNKLST